VIGIPWMPAHGAPIPERYAYKYQEHTVQAKNEHKKPERSNLTTTVDTTKYAAMAKERSNLTTTVDTTFTGPARARVLGIKIRSQLHF
jgi:hypothetical protein